MTYRLEQATQRIAVKTVYVMRHKTAGTTADMSVEQRAVLSFLLQDL